MTALSHGQVQPYGIFSLLRPVRRLGHAHRAGLRRRCLPPHGPTRPARHAHPHARRRARRCHMVPYRAHPPHRARHRPRRRRLRRRERPASHGQAAHKAMEALHGRGLGRDRRRSCARRRRRSRMSSNISCGCAVCTSALRSPCFGLRTSDTRSGWRTLIRTVARTAFGKNMCS